MPQNYEDASLPDRALGKLKQHIARLTYPTWRTFNDPRPVLSICFDDFPASAATTGARLLEQAGVRGTFYNCFGLPAGTLHAKKLQSAGHEIGCHTHDHINASFNALDEFTRSCTKNKRVAADYGIHLKHFSFPQGGMTAASKHFICKNYDSARGGFEGINNGKIDIFNLFGVPFYEQKLKKSNDFVDIISDNGGWLVLYSHDVSDSPSEHGITARSLEALLATLRQRNIRIKPVGEVIASLT
ncbi:MAG: polysaccharide deacetylase family protein [Alphaproteobacteria bacterium]